MSLEVRYTLANKARPSATETKTAFTNCQLLSLFFSFSAAAVSCRSKNGCKSSSTSSGKCGNTARPRQKLSNVKAASRIANGGKYSANRFQRAFISSRAVDKIKK